jgi:YHS domain-containing protein
MARDPVCGTEIDETLTPENLQSECGEARYYFCSPQCKMEFDRDRELYSWAA